jgi:PAS domain S-box-containing protein
LPAFAVAPERYNMTMAPAERGSAGLDLGSALAAQALAALDGLPEGAALLRPVREGGLVVDFTFQYANHGAGDAAGMPASALLGRRLLETQPSFPVDLFGGLVAVLEDGEPLRAALEDAGDDPAQGRLEIAASRLGDALLVVYEDVAARARAQAAEQRYGAVLEATSDWVSIGDPDLRLVYINAGGRRMVGIGLDEDIRGYEVGGFSPRWAREVVRRVALPVARRDGVWRGDGARLHRDGHEIPVSQVIVAHRGPDGEVDFYATIARDMTSERAAEAALRASEERFRIAFEQAPVGMALAALDGRYVQVNDAYCRTVRRDREELIGQTPLVITHPDDVADSANAMKRLIAGEGEEYSFEKRYVAPDGDTIWAELTVGVFRDDAGSPQYLIGMVQGIGDRRLAQTLQRSMLTTQLPQIEGVEVAVRYLPGSRDTEVGGDWYDLIPLPGGCVGVVVGDVVGRGIEAAATMSQLRTALRAYAIDGLEPAEVVRKLHRLADHLGEGLSTTLVYFDLDPATLELRYVSAGHVPALYVDASGEARYLEDARSTPLGTLPAGGEIPQARLVLAPGDTVLLYTDGLVERRDDGIISRLAKLREAFGCATGDLDECLERVTAKLAGDALRHDDIALLALRVDPA